jgi:hypothetical protein
MRYSEISAGDTRGLEVPTRTAPRGDSAGQRVRESRRVRWFRRNAIRPSPLLLRLHQEVLNGDVAPPKAVVHDLHQSLKAIELDALPVEDVGGPGAAEEGKEAEEHAENLGDIGHTQLPW